jgi:hypothetical protein
VVDASPIAMHACISACYACQACICVMQVVTTGHAGSGNWSGPLWSEVSCRRAGLTGPNIPT